MALLLPVLTTAHAIMERKQLRTSSTTRNTARRVTAGAHFYACSTDADDRSATRRRRAVGLDARAKIYGSEGRASKGNCGLRA